MLSGTIHIKSPGATSHLTAHVLLASIVLLTVQTRPTKCTALQPWLPPLPLLSWKAINITAAPEVDCGAQVIAPGVDRYKETRLQEECLLSHDKCMSPLCSLLIRSLKFVCYGHCICHNVSTTCSCPLWTLQG